ncbi:MAG: ABC transporter ATP-binding protein [Clostridiales bacterium]|nr:ABC transporter ATP-binding protein [Clostridiales bacterium]
MEEKVLRNVLEINDLVVSFEMYQKGFRKKKLEVLHSLSLDVKEGEIVAVVGSSGSGKSVLAHAVLGLLPKNATMTGNIKYQGELLTPKERKKYLGREIAFIPQSVDYLDPLMKVGKQVVGVYSSKERQRQLFEKYQLKKEVEDMYPFQLSGGMARRILISAAVTEEPKLIIADEPTPGLNVELAMDTLRHFRKLADNGTSILMITHDIDLAFQVADRIAVFYAGTIVEISPTGDFLAGGKNLRHPYSKAFITALPQNEFQPLKGTQPYAGDLPEGCLFAPRCPKAEIACNGKIAMRDLREGKVRCIHAT